ncbi:MAG: hypothetical protein ACE5E6_12770 [Phycisphaerae bacterium]
MANPRDTILIKRVRNEILVALQLVYPAALQALQIMRSLLTLFPTLEFEHCKRDLHYLLEKRYIQRVLTDAERPDNPHHAGTAEPRDTTRPNTTRNGDLTPWRRRWFRLTTTGVELAENLINDPALDES